MTSQRREVRPADARDVDGLVALMGEFYREAGYALSAPAARRTFLEILSAPALGGVWLMTVDGRPAGFVVLTLAFSMEFGGLRGFVDDLFVAPAYRRLGLAAAALDMVRAAGLARGVRALLVETSDQNAAAVGLYKRAGFQESGRLLMTQALAAPIHEDERA